MKKLNFDFSISERDKRLLMALLAIGIFACAYFFGYQKLTALSNKYDTQTETLTAQKKDLDQKRNNQEKYESDKASYNNVYNAVLSNYSSGTSQDATFDFLNKLQLITGAWIKSTSISDTSLIYTFGSVVSTNPSASGKVVYTTDAQGYKTTLTLSYEAAYSQWKSMIDFVNNYYSKNTIDSIAMTYNDVSKTVSGTMTVSTYAITGSQRKFTPPVFNAPAGTGGLTNIFSSTVFKSKAPALTDTNGDYILSNYDYFLMANASSSDLDSCIIGEKGDITRKSILSGNSDATQKVTIKFAGSAGNYTVQYKIGDVTYPAKDYDKGAAFVPGDTLDLLVMSSARLSAQDKSGINLTLENATDKTLNVKIANDDKENPRINCIGNTGSIKIFK